MSETDAIQTAIEARMASGEPFTFMDVWGQIAFGDTRHPAYRMADKTIQKWRRRGLIRIDGRKGHAPLWHYSPPTKQEEQGK